MLWITSTLGSFFDVSQYNDLIKSGQVDELNLPFDVDHQRANLGPVRVMLEKVFSHAIGQQCLYISDKIYIEVHGRLFPRIR